MDQYIQLTLVTFDQSKKGHTAKTEGSEDAKDGPLVPKGEIALHLDKKSDQNEEANDFQKKKQRLTIIFFQSCMHP